MIKFVASLVEKKVLKEKATSMGRMVKYTLSEI